MPALAVGATSGTSDTVAGQVLLVPAVTFAAISCMLKAPNMAMLLLATLGVQIPA